MKKVKNILFILIALLTFVNVVDAAEFNDYYKEKWVKNYTDEYSSLTSSIDVEDGIIVTGYKFNGTKDSGLVAKYDYSGKLIWEYLYDNSDTKYVQTGFMNAVLVKDGFIVAALSYDENYDFITYLVKYDFNGKVAKTIDLAKSDGSYEEQIILDGNGEYVTISYSDEFALYNSDGTKIGEKKSLSFPAVAMDKNIVYLFRNDEETGELLLEKYDFSLKLVDSKVLLTPNLSEDGITLMDYEFSRLAKVVNNKIVLHTYDSNMDAILSIINPNTYAIEKKVNLGNDVYVSDYVQVNDGIALIKENTDNCEVTPGNVNSPIDVRGLCTTTYDIIGYDMNLIELWLINKENYVLGLDSTNDYLILTGDIEGENDIYYANVTVFESVQYDVEIIENENGTATFEEIVNDDGTVVVKLNITPKKGYIVKSVVVKNSAGEEIEVKDNSFVKPESDVTVDVIYEKEVVTNPNTGLDNPFMICGIALAGAGIGYYFLKKKKYI